MVKPDPKRNYYAELSLPETATVADIKKQYRKLALKWHPDRNADNVEEATKQFQIIGEAHEILSDPTSKAKYDASRSKHRFPQASGVHGNPWQDVAKEYPAPPRRSNMPNRHPTAREKYGRMFGTASPSTQDAPEDGYSAYSAFQRMKQQRRKANSTQQSTSPPKPSYSGSSSRPPPPETPPRPPPRTEAQREKANAAFGSRSTSRPNRGFQPDSPATAGDEPQVSSSNYFSSKRHTSLFEDAMANARREREQAQAQAETQPRPSPESSSEIHHPPPEPDHVDKDGANDGFFGRTRRSYASPSGEKLDPHAGTTKTTGAPDLGRASSTRIPSSRKEHSPLRRQRSASVPDVEGAPEFHQGNHQQQQHERYNNTTNGLATNSRQKFKLDATQSTETHTPGEQRTATADSKTNMFSQEEKPSVYGKPFTRYIINPVKELAQGTSEPCLSPYEQKQHEILNRIIECRAAQQVKVAHQQKSSSFNSYEGANASVGAQSTGTINNCTHEAADGSADKGNYSGYVPARRHLASKTPGQHSRGSATSFIDTSANIHDFSFSFHINDDTFNTTVPKKDSFPNKSAESVSTTFTGYSNDSWNFTANNNIGSRVRTTKHRVSPQVGTSPLKKSRSGGADSGGWSSQQPPPIPPKEEGRPRAETAPGPGSGTSTNPQPFDPSEWSNKINSTAFQPPSTSSASTSPTRRGGTLRRKQPKHAFVEEISPSREDGLTSPFAEPSNASSPMAMDIDSPPINSNPTTARNIHVEPSNPKWRTGHHANGGASSVTPTSRPGPVPLQPLKAANGTDLRLPPAKIPQGSQSGPPPIQGSEDTEEFKASFSDLRKTEPFVAMKPSGLGSFKDLKSTLPFQSQASANLPIEREIKLNTPLPDMHAPEAPTIPANLSLPPITNTSRPTSEALQLVEKHWKSYMGSVLSYLEAYSHWDKRVAKWFDAVDTEMKERGIQGAGFGWLGLNRDDFYARLHAEMVRATTGVKKRWALEASKHEHIMAGVVETREQIKKVLGGT